MLNIAHQGGEDEFPSNTLYAFKKSVKAGADMLELDVGVTKDGKVVVSHDTTLDRTTNGHGTIESHTLKQIRRLDAAYWFAKGGDAVRARRAKAYKFRGIATGKRKPPEGLQAPRLPRADAQGGHEGLPAHPDQHRDQGPHARRGDRGVRPQRRGARGASIGRRGATSSSSPSSRPLDRFHELAPAIDVAPGVDGCAAFLLAAARPATASSPSSSRSPTSSATSCST